MIGIVLFVVVFGIAVVLRLFRRSQMGERLSDILGHLKASEILAGVLVSALLLVIAVSLIVGWLVFSVETAEVVAGWREPRTRSTLTVPTLPTVPTVPTLPPIPTFPTVPTVPDFTFPDIATPPNFPSPGPTTPSAGN